jgi:hypothetical protein
LLTAYTELRRQYGVRKFAFNTTANVIVSKRSTDGVETYDVFYGMGYEDAPLGAPPGAVSHLPCRATPLHYTQFLDSVDEVAELNLDAITRDQVEACFESFLSESGSSVAVHSVINLVCIFRAGVEGREHWGGQRIVRL